MILLIDNYDSFVFNLARYFERLGCETQVARNDAIDAAAVRRLAPSAVVLSPGPRAPEQAGQSIPIVRALYRELPILGICLGHQTIAAALGGRIERAPVPIHGRATPIFHQGEGVLAALPNPFLAARYHSLVVDAEYLPRELSVTARDADGTVMAIEHRRLPVVGYQFHPESILTELGYLLLAAFLRRAGMVCPDPLPSIAEEQRAAIAPQRALTPSPVTF